MATAPAPGVSRHIRRLLEAQATSLLTDGDLLDRFVAHADEAAFAQLVRRHGPMVMGLCRRALRNPADAEDAFQAAFLLLARKAAVIRRGGSVASWLYCVARRVAWRLREGIQRRSAHEAQGSAMSPTDVPDPAAGANDELRRTLDEELGRLPEKYRAPLVLCYLQGHDRAAAARHLGWSPGAVKIRLERGRDLLRQRLARQGFALGGGALAALLCEAPAGAAVPAGLVRCTARAAALLAAGQGAGAGVVSERAITLVEEMRKPMLLSAWKTTTAVLLTAGLLGLGTPSLLRGLTPEAPAAPPAAAAAADAPERADTLGDLLPPEARARLGTVRFRHEGPVVFTAHTPDGKLLVTATQAGGVYVWEADTGKAVRTLVAPAAGPADPLQEAFMTLYRGASGTIAALAPDGKTLATVPAPGTAVRLWDVATGKEVKQWKAPSPVGQVAFAPDGKSLFTKDQDTLLRQWDLDGKEVRKFGEALKGNFRNGGGWGGLAASPDGKAVATVVMLFENNASQLVVKRWEIGTGKELPSVRGPAGGVAPVFSPDGKALAWVAPFTAAITLIDLETGKELRELQGTALVFAPDGKNAVVLGKDHSLALWDVAGGKEVRKLDGAGMPEASISFPYPLMVPSMAFTPDGKRFTSGAGNLVRQWDVTTGKELTSEEGHRGAVTRVVLSADGKTVLTRGADNALCQWEAATGKRLRRTALPAKVYHVAAPADAQPLLLSGGGQFWTWDVKAEKVIKEWKGHEEPVAGLALTADGKTAASRSQDKTIRIWDTATGKELRRIEDVVDKANPNTPGATLGFAFGDSDSLGLLFAPDGGTLAALPATPSEIGLQSLRAGNAKVPEGYAVRLWDVGTGKLVRQFADARSYVHAGTFAPDGRTLATAHTDNTVVLWEVATGKERFRFNTGAGRPLTVLTYSADGKFLAGGGPDGAARVWEAETGKERVRRTGHRSALAALALSGDARTLVSGSADTTGLVWDLPALPLPKLAAREVDAKQAAALWADLAAPEPAKAYEAMRALAGSPREAVAVMRGHLRAVEPPDEQKLARLVADLDGAKFDARQKAEDELARLAELAEPALKKVLEAQPGLETRQRVQKLLERIVTESGTSPEKLQALRALAALEDLGTPEAKELVEQLSKGAAGSRLTREAKATLDRLNRRAER